MVARKLAQTPTESDNRLPLDWSIASWKLSLTKAGFTSSSSATHPVATT